MSEKIIRDPVHDVIVLRTDRPLEALLFRLLNAPQVQRLRRVRQLGLASLAYPGADHSRYSHSLGVMETARKMINRLRSLVSIDPEKEAMCLVSALLHDLGHGPFSHVFERISGLKHEQITGQIIEDKTGEVNRLLVDFDRQMPSKVAAVLEGQPKRTFFNDILASAKKAVNGKKNDVGIKRMIVDVIEENSYKTKGGWFSDWYARLKKDINYGA